MEIRFAQSKDVAGILTLLKQVGALHHNLRPDIFRANACKYGPSQLFALMENMDTPIFVAADGDTILGYCFCQIQRTEKSPVLCDRLTLYIDDLCVLEGHRGQGIGKALYDQVVRYGKMRRCNGLALNVWQGNDNAQHFYEKLGFTPQRTILEQTL